MRGAHALVVVAGHDRPGIPAPSDPRVTFVAAPSPVTRGGSVRDKQRKKDLIGDHLKGSLGGPTWFMFMDADDRVRPQLALYLRPLDADACAFVSGSVFDASNDVVALLPGSPPFFEWCGTSVAFRLSEADLHGTADAPAFIAQMRNHRLFAAVTEAAGRRCELLVLPARRLRRRDRHQPDRRQARRPRRQERAEDAGVLAGSRRQLDPGAAADPQLRTGPGRTRRRRCAPRRCRPPRTRWG